MACLRLVLSVISIFLADPVLGIEGNQAGPLNLQPGDKDWRAFQAFKEWMILSNGENGNPITRAFEEWKAARGMMVPSKEENPAAMARFIVNQANWTSVATISSREDIPSFPFAGVASVSDGSVGDGSGIPYMYLTPLDLTAQDLAKDSRATLMMTLAQGSWCKEKLMDPMDPRCARVGLSGTIKKILPSDLDYDTAKAAVFGRHPWLSHMPEDHHFFFAKLGIESIVMLDAFGGPKYIAVNDYFNPISFVNNKASEIGPSYRTVLRI